MNIKRSAGCIGLGAWLLVSAVHAQHYTNGQIGSFGINAADSSAWRNGAGLGTFNTANQYDTRFTALENLTVDRVFQRITGITGGSLTVELRNDNGSGLPGTLVTSATVTPTADIQSVVFGSAASLAAGNVYHVVYKTTTGG